MWSEVVQQFSAGSAANANTVWLTFAVAAILKITLILIVGWIATAAMRKQSASARHVVWGLTLLAVLLVPAGMWLLPGWGSERTLLSPQSASATPNVPRLSRVDRSLPVEDLNGAELIAATGLDPDAAPTVVPNDEHVGQTTANLYPAGVDRQRTRETRRTPSNRTPASSSEVDPRTAETMPRPVAEPVPTKTAPATVLSWSLAVVWAIGFLTALVPFIVGLARVGRLHLRAKDVEDPEWQTLWQEICSAINIRRPVRLLRSDSRVGPLAGGVLRPFVLLPTDCDDWSPERRRMVLLHELGHIQRGDVLTQWSVRGICALYWFHPLVWLAARQMRIERERACDDLVLSTGMQPTEYSQQLVEIAASYRSPGWAAVSAMAMARPCQLEDRVRCLLDNDRRRMRLSRTALTLVIACSFALAATIATAGKVVVRDANGKTVAEIIIPPGGSVSLEETPGANNVAVTPATKPVDGNRPPANDWPMWGGTTHRNNVSSATNLPETWDTETGKNVLWSSQLGSVIMGGMVVAGDHIFVGTNNNAGLNPRFPKDIDLGCLVCLDRKTGRFLWQHSNRKLKTGRVHDWPVQGIVSTPCVDGDRLWYVTNRCEVVCLDVDGFRDGENDGPFTDEEVTGEPEADVIWQLDMMKQLGVTPHNVSACSPVTDGKRLFVITGNGTDATHVNPPPKGVPDVICLDRETGKILWQDTPAGQRTLHASWSSPTYGVIKGQPMVLMGCGDGWLYAYDPAGDGEGKAKLLWKFDCNPKDAPWKLGGQGRRNPYVGIPVIHNNKVYVRTGQDPEHGGGQADLWCIDPVKHLDGSDVSATQVFAGVIAGKPVGQPLPPRRLQNLDVEKGEVELPNPKSAVIWRYRKQDQGGDPVFGMCNEFSRGLGSMSIADGLLFISDGVGFAHCLDANTGKCYWVYDLFANSYGTPLIADGKVYFADEDGDIAVFKVSKTQTLLQEIMHINSVNCTPVACGNILYVLDKTILYAIASPDAAANHAPATSQNTTGASMRLNVETLPKKPLKEPQYRSGKPLYCQLVFGKNAEKHLWLVLDLAAESTKNTPEQNVAYLDRDGDGDLTKPGNRIVGTAKKHSTIVSFRPKPLIRFYPYFELGDIVDHNGTRHTNAILNVERDSHGPRPQLRLKLAGKYDQLVGYAPYGSLLRFSEKPQDAPTLRFDGPLSIRAITSNGRLFIPSCPLALDDPARSEWFQKNPPRYGEEKLIPGEDFQLEAEMGTPGRGRGTFAKLFCGMPPKNVHPQAEVIFENGSKISATLSQRCCTTIFRTTIKIPADAPPGVARILLSYPEWPAGAVLASVKGIQVGKPVAKNNHPVGQPVTTKPDDGQPEDKEKQKIVTLNPVVKDPAGVIWGEPAQGLRLGIRSAQFAKHDTRFRHGDWLRYEVWVKNETRETIYIPGDPRDIVSPGVKKNFIDLQGYRSWASFAIPLEDLDRSTVSISPGKSAQIKSPQAPILPANTQRGRYGPPPLALKPGKHTVTATASIWFLSGGYYDRRRRDGQTAELKAGRVEIDVLPAARLQVVQIHTFGGKRTRESVQKDSGLRILQQVSRDDGTTTEFVLNQSSEVLFDNHDVKSAVFKTATGDSDNFLVEVELAETAAEYLTMQTKGLTVHADPTRRLGILLDGKVIAAPRLMEGITGGKLHITGNFTKEQAAALTEALRASAKMEHGAS